MRIRLETPFWIAARTGLSWIISRRDVERQIGGIDEAAHEAQIAWQQRRLIGDEHAAHIKLHPAGALGVEQVERLCLGNEGEHAIFVQAFGAVVERQRGLVELASGAAVEILSDSRRDLASWAWSTVPRRRRSAWARRPAFS